MSLTSFLRNWRKNEDGSGTIEFVVIFPVIMFIFAVAFEAGLYMVRNAMLERAVDVAIRDVRLGGDVPNIDDLRNGICNEAVILKDCQNSIQIQMTSLDIVPDAMTAEEGPIRCVDKASDEDSNEFTDYEVGVENQLMLVKVCAIAQPLFPTTGLGLQMPVDGNDNYAIVATAAFVNEPGQRIVTPPTTGGGSTGTGGIGIGVGQ